jgi:hypothetical protein
MEWETTDPSQDRAAAGESSSILDDDASLVELLFERPELIAEDVLLIAEARAGSESGMAGRIAIGWRRGGGPLVIGVTTGSGSEALLVEAISHAAKMDAWPLARWNEHVRRYWAEASPELAERVATRWALPSTAWDVASWTNAAWGEEPLEGPCAIALVATRIPEACERAIAWLTPPAAIAAFRIRWYGEDATPGPRIERVTGGWPATTREANTSTSPEPITAPTRDDVAAREPVTAPTHNDVAGSLIDQIEALCTELGCRVSRRGEEWVRIDGIGRTVRAFPGTRWLDLQLVGVDEGSLVGLSYRHGVSLAREAPPGAPPGVHLRLEGTELEPGVRSLLVAWLGGRAEEPGGRTRPPHPPAEARPRKPRNPRPNRPH